MTARLSQLRPVPRRGLSHDEAAMYVGISVSKFDEMVLDGRMPTFAILTLPSTRYRVTLRPVWDGKTHEDQAPLPRVLPK